MGADLTGSVRGEGSREREETHGPRGMVSTCFEDSAPLATLSRRFPAAKVEGQGRVPRGPP